MHLAQVRPDRPVELVNGDAEAEMLLHTGVPSESRLAGPFVMNKRSELRQAFADYRTGFGLASRDGPVHPEAEPVRNPCGRPRRAGPREASRASPRSRQLANSGAASSGRLRKRGDEALTLWIEGRLHEAVDQCTEIGGLLVVRSTTVAALDVLVVQHVLRHCAEGGDELPCVARMNRSSRVEVILRRTR